ncbi:MAG: SH3 domain-containing protein [Moorea sp. SIO4A3]|nr:SH3 domain-containing protein [Moorena sp. SIO4A3]
MEFNNLFEVLKYIPLSILIVLFYLIIAMGRGISAIGKLFIIIPPEFVIGIFIVILFGYTIYAVFYAPSKNRLFEKITPLLVALMPIIVQDKLKEDDYNTKKEKASPIPSQPPTIIIPELQLDEIKPLPPRPPLPTKAFVNTTPSVKKSNHYPLKDIENPQTRVTKQSPSQAVRKYYSMLNNRQYSQTWDLLSPDFKIKHSKDNFYGYKTWWNKVDWIVIDKIKPIRQEGNRAIVKISLTYQLKNGCTIEDYNKIFHLVFKENTNSWILDDKLKGGSAPNCRSQGEANATIVTTDPTEPIKNVRSSPNTDGDNIVKKIRIGSRVEVLKEGRDRTNHRWYKIYDPSSEIRGWIAGQFVERD